MKGYHFVKSIALTFLVIVIPSTQIRSTAVRKAHGFTAPTKFSSREKLHRRGEKLRSRSKFSDELFHFLDGQSEVSYRSVGLPSNILTVYPSVKNIGNKFIEVERKSEIETDRGNVILLHLISSPTRLEHCLPPKFQKDLTEYFSLQKENGLSRTNYSKVIHLHEDIWDFKRDIVHHRLMAQLGLGVNKEKTTNQESSETHRSAAVIRRIFARKTTVRRITSSLAMEFLDEHHLWGATKAKHNYGLFFRSNGKSSSEDDELVAVATFSAKRKILRLGKQHRSHELLRFCSKKDSNVVGGISKLIKAFVHEKSPDDIVTVVDRDWGDGSGWHSFGFHTVATMDPIVMAVCESAENVDTSHSNKRRHLVGAGIRITNSTSSKGNDKGSNSDSKKRNDRIGLSQQMLKELDSYDSTKDILCTLSNHKHFPVYDTGVERLMKVISYDSDGKEVQTTTSTIVEMWQNSQPTYAKEYYSPNRGIAALLKNASVTPSALPLLLAGDNTE